MLAFYWENMAFFEEIIIYLKRAEFSESMYIIFDKISQILKIRYHFFSIFSVQFLHILKQSSYFINLQIDTFLTLPKLCYLNKKPSNYNDSCILYQEL